MVLIPTSICVHTQCGYTYVHACCLHLHVYAHGSHLYMCVPVLYTCTRVHVYASLKLKACFAQAHCVCPAVRWIHDSRTICG